MVDKIDEEFILDDEEFDKNNNREQNQYKFSVDSSDINNTNLDEYTIRIFGLDNGGKSTLLLNLINPREGNVAEITEDFNADVYIYKNTKINFWDISGKKDYRQYWCNYFHSSDGFIYVIDISSVNRLEESKQILKNLILSDEDNKSLPLLIYANKSDKLKKEIKSEEVYKLLELEQNENIFIQICSASKIIGLKEGFDWLFEKIVTY